MERCRGFPFCLGGHFFHNNWHQHQWRGLLLFERYSDNASALVVLNFSEYDHQVNFTFQRSGDYLEQLQGEDKFEGIEAGDTLTLLVPAHDGRVWLASQE